MTRGRASRAARLARTLATLAFVAGVVLWLVLLRPTALGGSTTYVVVAGDSMSPTYQAGDLVVAQPAGDYGPGSVVVFRIPDGQPGAGRLVIHRITGADANGYTTRGDHNSYTDPWHPGPADVVGTPAHHLPGVGTAIGFLRTPSVAGLLAALATMVWLWQGRRKTSLVNADVGSEVRIARPNLA